MIMKTLYSNLNLTFSVEGRAFRAVHVILEQLTKRIPSHSHGKGCYEIHYIPSGAGRALIGGVSYDIAPNTLYVTGPQVEHSQISNPEDPMLEYCVYLVLPRSPGKLKNTQDSAAGLFEKTSFWFGQDSCGAEAIFRRIFYELRNQQTGYMTQIQSLLSQLVIALVRNYEQPDTPAPSFSASNLNDSKSIILEEYFLYEYANLSLEQLSARLALSTRQTERLIRELYNKTFRQKKTEARMSAAVLLLSDPVRSISSVAEELGYSSVEHFSTAFRRYYGESASAYRAKEN